MSISDVERIADMPRVSEALANFAEETTGDNGLELVRAVMECKCDLRTKLVGDGCEVCNPELAAEMTAQEVGPVGYISDARLNDLVKMMADKTCRNKVLELAIFGKQDDLSSHAIYTHPQSDKLRKAAEEVVDGFDNAGEVRIPYGFLRNIENLRTALEGK